MLQNNGATSFFYALDLDPTVYSLRPNIFHLTNEIVQSQVSLVLDPNVNPPMLSMMYEGLVNT